MRAKQVARMVESAFRAVEDAEERAKEVVELGQVERDWRELAIDFMAAEVELAARAVAKARGEGMPPRASEELREALMERYRQAVEAGRRPEEALKEVKELARAMILEATEEAFEALARRG